MASIVEEIKESLSANSKGNLPVPTAMCADYSTAIARTYDCGANYSRKVIDGPFLHVIFRICRPKDVDIL